MSVVRLPRASCVKLRVPAACTTEVSRFVPLAIAWTSLCAGLLSPVPPGPWFWMRAGGDLMDLAVLGRAIGRDNPRRKIAYAAFGAVAAIAVVDLAIAIHAARNRREERAAAA